MNEEKILRGDIFTTIKPDQTEGSPCLVVSSDEVNESSLCVMVVYLNDKPARNETDVTINAKGLRVADCSRVYTLHKSRIAEYVRSCTDTEMGEIQEAILSALGIYAGVDLVDPKEVAENANLKKDVEILKDECNMYMKSFEDMRNERDELKEQVENLKAINRELAQGYKEAAVEMETVELKECVMISENEIRLQTERDLYKKLYDETLDKLLGAKA